MYQLKICSEQFYLAPSPPEAQFGSPNRYRREPAFSKIDVKLEHAVSEVLCRLNKLFTVTPRTRIRIITSAEVSGC